MPLDDETGTRFLNGLLCTASVEAKSHLQKNKGSGCQFYWSENHPNQIRAIISLPDELTFPIISTPQRRDLNLPFMKMVKKSPVSAPPMHPRERPCQSSPA